MTIMQFRKLVLKYYKQEEYKLIEDADCRACFKFVLKTENNRAAKIGNLPTVLNISFKTADISKGSTEDVTLTINEELTTNLLIANIDKTGTKELSGNIFQLLLGIFNDLNIKNNNSNNLSDLNNIIISPKISLTAEAVKAKALITDVNILSLDFWINLEILNSIDSTVNLDLNNFKFNLTPEIASYKSISAETTLPDLDIIYTIDTTKTKEILSLDNSYNLSWDLINISANDALNLQEEIFAKFNIGSNLTIKASKEVYIQFYEDNQRNLYDASYKEDWNRGINEFILGI